MAWRWRSPGGEYGYSKPSQAAAREDAVGCAICMQRGVKAIEPPENETMLILWQGLKRAGWVVEEVVR